MKYENTMLLSDLDGTLLSSDGSVSPENRAAIAAYIADGGAFGISTGRGAWNARALLPALPINAPSIVLNGAGIYDYEKNRFLTARYADKAVLLPLIHWCLENTPRVDLQAYTPEEIYYLSSEKTVHRPFLAVHKPYRFAAVEETADIPFFKCLFFGPMEELRRIEAFGASNEAIREALYCVHSTTDVIGRVEYIEFMPRGIHKGLAVRELQAQFPQKTLIAIGDYWNDMEMLQAADVAVAPDNALPEIKALCRAVVADNRHHAIADTIGNVIPAL